jgi:hypothetical protein
VIPILFVVAAEQVLLRYAEQGPPGTKISLTLAADADFRAALGAISPVAAGRPGRRWQRGHHRRADRRGP